MALDNNNIGVAPTALHNRQNSLKELERINGGLVIDPSRIGIPAGQNTASLQSMNSRAKLIDKNCLV